MWGGNVCPVDEHCMITLLTWSTSRPPSPPPAGLPFIQLSLQRRVRQRLARARDRRQRQLLQFREHLVVDARKRRRRRCRDAMSGWGAQSRSVAARQKASRRSRRRAVRPPPKTRTLVVAVRPVGEQLQEAHDVVERGTAQLFGRARWGKGCVPSRRARQPRLYLLRSALRARTTPTDDGSPARLSADRAARRRTAHSGRAGHGEPRPQARGRTTALSRG